MSIRSMSSSLCASSAPSAFAATAAGTTGRGSGSDGEGGDGGTADGVCVRRWRPSRRRSSIMLAARNLPRGERLTAIHPCLQQARLGRCGYGEPSVGGPFGAVTDFVAAADCMHCGLGRSCGGTEGTPTHANGPGAGAGGQARRWPAGGYRKMLSAIENSENLRAIGLRKYSKRKNCLSIRKE